MEIETKKKVMFECIRLGMDQYSSMIVAEFSDEEIKIAQEDTDIQRKILLNEKLEERELLLKFDSCMQATVANGDSKDVRWKLSKINPNRFGEGQKDKALNGSIRLNIDFGKTDEALLKEDNVEVSGDSGN